MTREEPKNITQLGKVVVKTEPLSAGTINPGEARPPQEKTPHLYWTVKKEQALQAKIEEIARYAIELMRIEAGLSSDPDNSELKIKKAQYENGIDRTNEIIKKMMELKHHEIPIPQKPAPEALEVPAETPAIQGEKTNEAEIKLQRTLGEGAEFLKILKFYIESKNLVSILRQLIIYKPWSEKGRNILEFSQELKTKYKADFDKLDSEVGKLAPRVDELAKENGFTEQETAEKSWEELLGILLKRGAVQQKSPKPEISTEGITFEAIDSQEPFLREFLREQSTAPENPVAPEASRLIPEEEAELAELERANEADMAALNALLAQIEALPDDEETHEEIWAKIQAQGNERRPAYEAWKVKILEIDRLQQELAGLGWGERKKRREIEDKINALRQEKNSLQEKLDDLRTRVDDLWKKYDTRTDFERQERERAEREKKEQEKRELGEDKKLNPFKYFVTDKMHDSAFWCLYGTDKEKVTLKEIGWVGGSEESGKDGKRVSFWGKGRVLPALHNTIEFSSNGFTLQLQNPDEVIEEREGKRTTIIDSPKAKYMLVSPEWKHYEGETALSYEQGMHLLQQKAKEYQKQLLEEFDKSQSK